VSLIANRAHPLSCIKLAFNGGDIVWTGRAASMRRFAMKALFTALAFRSVGLVALYVYGKAISRW
jgi:hypothetical protein